MKNSLSKEEYIFIKESIEELRCPKINLGKKKHALKQELERRFISPSLKGTLWEIFPPVMGYPTYPTPSPVYKFLYNKLKTIYEDVKYKMFFKELKLDIENTFYDVFNQIKDEKYKNFLIELLDAKLKDFNVNLGDRFIDNCYRDFVQKNADWFESNIADEISFQQKYAEKFFKRLQSELITML